MREGSTSVGTVRRIDVCGDAKQPDASEQAVANSWSLRFAQLDAEAGPYPWSQKQWLSSLLEQPCFGFEVAGEYQAAVVLYPLVGSDDIEILNVVVAQSAQGQGLAKQFLNQLLESLADGDLLGSRFERVLLEVRESNIAAIAVYETLGFEYDGRRKHYYPLPAGIKPAREDALLMSKRLVCVSEN